MGKNQIIYSKEIYLDKFLEGKHEDEIVEKLEKICSVIPAKNEGERRFLYFDGKTLCNITVQGIMPDSQSMSFMRYINLDVMPETAEIPIEISVLLEEYKILEKIP